MSMDPVIYTTDALEDELIKDFGVKTQGMTWDDEGAHDQCAEDLKVLMRNKFLTVDALNERGLKRFFAAHRVMSGLTQGHDKRGAFGVRFTVQYNLFFGTINALGSDLQRRQMRDMHDAGELGCFLLTEKAAGVLSGLIVATTATHNGDGYTLHTPSADAAKVWISQGLCAKWGVVIANLVVKGTNHGPHGFLIDLTSAGVTRADMGRKTAFNSLDNAHISFSNVALPADALLSKSADVVNGEYTFEGAKPPSFVKLAQRLLSGRLAISDSAISYFLRAMSDTKHYLQRREVFVDQSQKKPVFDLPYVQDLFGELAGCARVYMQYIKAAEAEFAEAVYQDHDPSRRLQMKISAAKAEAVDFATTGLSQLRTKVGSYSLMEDSPFGRPNDILYCMRFAEGDTHVLQQSIARAVMTPYVKSPLKLLLLVVSLLIRYLLAAVGLLSWSPAARLSLACDTALLSLLWFMKTRSGKLGKLGAWYAAGNRVYNLAKLVSLQTVHQTVVAKHGRSADTDRFLARALKDAAAL
eukprot:TRINITY_DN3267_c0_g1_i1.p1 TRINITY_DN3267_c0_g1~~TRINITY_DN3267_c0_g1_i1.p1  ORF type:complete len:525 (+),score=206.87 TRINITY_DN3267_c0_g1_i1:71-1645(+)